MVKLHNYVNAVSASRWIETYPNVEENPAQMLMLSPPQGGLKRLVTLQLIKSLRLMLSPPQGGLKHISNIIVARTVLLMLSPPQGGLKHQGMTDS